MAVAYVGIFTNVGVTGYFARCYYRERERRKRERGGKEEGEKNGKKDSFRSMFFLRVYAPNFTSHLPCLHCFQAARGGINVETERGAARTVSELTLAAVTPHDVGKYSCRPTEGRTDTVMLIVEPG